MAASDASGAPAIAAAPAAPTCLNKARRETSRGALSSVRLAMHFLQFSPLKRSSSIFGNARQLTASRRRYKNRISAPPAGSSLILQTLASIWNRRDVAKRVDPSPARCPARPTKTRYRNQEIECYFHTDTSSPEESRIDGRIA